MSTEDITLTSGLWFLNQVLFRRGNGCSGHLIKILTWGYTTDSPRHLYQLHIYIDAMKKWDYQLAIKDDLLISALAEMIIDGWPDDNKDVLKGIMTILWTTRFTHCRGWTYLTWRSNHSSPRRKEQVLGINPSGTLGPHLLPVQGKTMCILALHQQGYQTVNWSMFHMSNTLTSRTKATTEASTTTWVTLATTRSWLHDV